jgi:aminocarboxymuconate-semialdehyde decarboxylase
MPAAVLENMAALVPPDLTVRPEGRFFHVMRGGARMASFDPDYMSNATRQLADMDAAGITIAVQSAAVYQEWMTMKAARVYNRELAELQAAYPDRFVCLAHVPPFGEDGALEELERSIRDYGLRGVCITTNFRGKYPDEREYWPFYAKVNELGVPVFVHAAGCPFAAPVLDQYGLGSSLGRGLDHALVTARVLYSGVLEEFPKLRFLMGHLGGAFYGMVSRLLIDAPSRPANKIPPRPYFEQLRRIWFDTAPSFWQGPPEVAHAIATLGDDRICLGSDYPAGLNSDAVLPDAVATIKALGLEGAAFERIAVRNAAELFGLS